MSSSSTQNQLEMRDYTCPECNIGLRVLSLPSASPPYCPLCNVASYFTSSTPFEVGPNPFEDDEESQFLDPMESLPTIKISSSMLSSASSDDSALPCAISEKISWLENLLGDCHATIYTIMIALFLGSQVITRALSVELSSRLHLVKTIVVWTCGLML
ncbi:unnamed protein product [Arabidopsis thaliana]|uniref:Uncharacterized protein n=1 Tax=Arabidopsis thaliana TaxID=3702 RepID=A0A5S9X6W4_ARATH|nr:unnamed protein product [Arabidopsis thaliana]